MKKLDDLINNSLAITKPTAIRYPNGVLANLLPDREASHQYKFDTLNKVLYFVYNQTTYLCKHSEKAIEILTRSSFSQRSMPVPMAYEETFLDSDYQKSWEKIFLES